RLHRPVLGRDAPDRGRVLVVDRAAGPEAVARGATGAPVVDVSGSAGPGRGPGFDDDGAPDAATPLASGSSRLDVSPRLHTGRPARPARTRTVLAIGGLVLLFGALGVVLFNGLNDAALF